MTLTQRLLASHAGLETVRAGQLIEASLDLVMGNDITTPVAIGEYGKCGAEKIFDADKVVFVLDHFVPNKDIKSAENCRMIRNFATSHGIKNLFDVGEMGIEHALLPEKGLVLPGDTVIGADSHTCTYGALGAFSTGVGSTDMAAGMISGKCWFKVPSAIKIVLLGKPQRRVTGKDVILNIIGRLGVDGARYRSLEFCGDGVKNLSMDSRLCIANMAVECGAKNGIFIVDDLTLEYVAKRSNKKFQKTDAPQDSEYDEVITIDLGEIEQTVAKPHLPSNIAPARELSEIKIDQAVIGSCTNGRMEDMRAAAEILKGKHVAKGVRLIVIPATQQIYLDCIKEGLTEIFISAGAAVSTPTCGPCLGGYMGILAKGETAIATTNRNFVGRMGHPESFVYLASPAVAAASAIAGRIVPAE